MEKDLVKNLSHLNLQHEIRTLHLWMERRGFQGIEAQFFETNSTRLQDTLMENSTRLPRCINGKGYKDKRTFLKKHIVICKN